MRRVANKRPYQWGCKTVTIYGHRPKALELMQYARGQPPHYPNFFRLRLR